MYTSPKIISEPISNNRLNWDERENKTIVVPSLIEGSLDDVIIGEETVIEAEVNGTIIAGKGLQHFIFLKDSRVPTWIMDNHNHAFAFWHEALAKGFIQEGGLLIHIDQHTDLALPNQIKILDKAPLSRGVAESRGVSDSNTKPPFDSPLDRGAFGKQFYALKEVEDYTNTVLTIADFIVPALATGLISKALMVMGENKEGAGVFSWEKSGLKKTGNSKLETQNSLIVDLDLDYFSQGFDEKICLENVRYWLEKADIVTIATSPLFIDQEKALSVLKSLQKSLVAL